MNKRQLFKAVGVGFALTVSALPVSSDYHQGTRIYGLAHTGYYLFGLRADEGYGQAIEFAAEEWRRDGGSNKVTPELVRRTTRPPGNNYDIWRVSKASDEGRPKRTLGITFFVPSNVRLPMDKIVRINWGGCRVYLFWDNIEGANGRWTLTRYSAAWEAFSKAVALHEFGHTLKLEHADTGEWGAKRTPLPQNVGSIMRATLSPSESVLNITAYDKQELQEKWPNSTP